MPFPITRPGKAQLVLDAPIMPAAGALGYGQVYRDLLKLEKLGAFVTPPVSYAPRSPAHGTRVVPLESGFLLHTGLPNPGISKVMNSYRDAWADLGLPIILHLIATSEEQVRKAVSRADAEAVVDAIELGLEDGTPWREADRLISAAVRNTEKAVLVRLPFLDAHTLGQAAADAGAGAVVACAPPRGTARDPLSGRLVEGRVYGPLMRPAALNLVAALVIHLPAMPIIGAGGIHTPQDARDFFEVGACAVQVDSVSWVQPNQVETIARDLGGGIVTRPTGATVDDWHPGMGDTEKAARQARRKAAAPDAPPPVPGTDEESGRG